MDPILELLVDGVSGIPAPIQTEDGIAGINYFFTEAIRTKDLDGGGLISSITVVRVPLSTQVFVLAACESLLRWCRNLYF